MQTDTPAGTISGFRRGVDFEVALDGLGGVIAHCAQVMAQERDRASPDAAMIAAYQRIQHAVRMLRDDLAPEDAAALAQVRRQFGPLLRVIHASVPHATHDPRRRQFAQAWASLALEGQALDLAQWAIHEQVILGALDHEAACDALRAMHEQPS